jgi:hypothetical protein
MSNNQLSFFRGGIETKRVAIRVAPPMVEQARSLRKTLKGSESLSGFELSPLLRTEHRRSGRQRLKNLNR